jgi:hypothetical protein
MLTGTCMFCMMGGKVEKDEDRQVAFTTCTNLGGREEGNKVWRSVVGQRTEFMCSILPALRCVVREAFESSDGTALVQTEILM